MTQGSPERGIIKQRRLNDPFQEPAASLSNSAPPKTNYNIPSDLRYKDEDRSSNEEEGDNGNTVVASQRVRKTNKDEDEEENEDEDEEGNEYADKKKSEDESEGENEDESEGENEDEDEDDEPKLKYARLTQQVGGIYRNGDATSAFLVSGEKMIIGTHNGNIHVTQLPNFQPLKVYHAHSASVTSVSIWPKPPISKPGSNTPLPVVYIATSSMDGNICVQSLIDTKDVQLRNFARPLQAVALSPDYKNDRMYLSGGRAGQLVLTMGSPQGRSTATTVGTAAAAAAGWLGSVGLGHNTGKETVLHSGEGTISAIKWSHSGKYVVWLNEHGIKIMRSKLHLESSDIEDAWKRIGHIDRPQTDEWEEMAGMWKGRVEWIDEAAVECDDPKQGTPDPAVSPAAARLKQTVEKSSKIIERLLVGWGGTLWIIHVHPGGIGTGKNAGEKTIGRAEIVKILRMDCIISGVSLYTPNLLLVLAYCLPDEEEEETGKGNIESPIESHRLKPSIAFSESAPSNKIKRHSNSQPPELRLIDLVSQAEIEKDGLTVSRYERLSSNDYHLGTLFVPDKAVEVAPSSAFGALTGLGTDVLSAALYPKSLFSSGASVKSKDDSTDAPSVKRTSTIGSVKAMPPLPKPAHPGLRKPGLKIFIHSPYDCILATKRDLGDHLVWLMEHQHYQQAWELVEDHPEIIGSVDKLAEMIPTTPDRKSTATDDFFDDASSYRDTASRVAATKVDCEKRRIGELWIQQLVEAGDWTSAGRVCGKVLGASDRWEKWVWTFATSKKFDEITPFIPADTAKPLPRTIYEIVLGHYLKVEKPRFKLLLDQWSLDLYDINTIITALENQLKFRDVREESIEDGERGRDWRIVVEALARLYEANGRHREALKSYVKLQDADSVFRLIKENHLADAVIDDIPSFIALRVQDAKLTDMSQDEVEEATSEAIALLVDEAQHGLVKPQLVVEQLEKEGFNMYLFFYLRALWLGTGTQIQSKMETVERLIEEGRILVNDFADLVVVLFADYDRPLLMDFLKASTNYTFEKAVQECESHSYIPELVYLYSKTGQMKRALFLIIDRLQDVSQAIAFAKEQNDPDLWDDLLNYSMDKPHFIRGLLEEVGTAIDPIKLVQRIPEGLEIEGLREGIRGIIREHEIQWSILEGTSRVLRSEVAGLQRGLRSGQRKGIKFEVTGDEEKNVTMEASIQAEAVVLEGDESHDYFWHPHLHSLHGSGSTSPSRMVKGSRYRSGRRIMSPTLMHSYSHKTPRPGHCAACHVSFGFVEQGTLVGFACGHIFHLKHLLRELHPQDYVSENEGENDQFVEDLAAMSVAAKVGNKTMHARLLRDRISGCPVCKKERDMVDGHA